MRASHAYGNRCPVSPELNESASRRSVPTVSAIPSRVRGERFDQRNHLTYSFCNYEIVANLRADHDHRAIIIQVDVANAASDDVDWPTLSSHRADFAHTLLGAVRRRLIGPIATLRRIARRRPASIEIEGPFIPRQKSLATMTLIIRVNRDGNYDQLYDVVRQFLEMHRCNDDRSRFAQRWLKNQIVNVKTKESGNGYRWTPEELDAVERMARLESPDHDGESDMFSDQKRRNYNDQLFEVAQRDSQLRRARVRDASSEADRALRRFFLGD